MIADEIAAASPQLRRFLNQAHIVRVPFSVYPWDDSDGQPGMLWAEDRIPRGLIPRDKEQRYVTEWARPPFPVVALVSQLAEKGLLLILSADSPDRLRSLAESLRRLDPFTSDIAMDTWLARFMSLPSPRWEWSSACFLVGLPIPGVVMLNFMGAFHSSEGFARRPTIVDSFYRTTDFSTPDREVMTTIRLESIRQALAQAIINGQPYDVGEYVAGIEAEITADNLQIPVMSYRRSLEHVTLSAITAFALLGCRNVRPEAIIPAQRLQDARKRKGQLPLYRYHVLKVFPTMVSGSPSGKGEDLAVHWVRGHFKDYREKGLFGKYPGVYWWSHHLAGTAPRFVDKEYELPE